MGDGRGQRGEAAFGLGRGRATRAARAARAGVGERGRAGWAAGGHGSGRRLTRRAGVRAGADPPLGLAQRHLGQVDHLGVGCGEGGGGEREGRAGPPRLGRPRNRPRQRRARREGNCGKRRGREASGDSLPGSLVTHGRMPPLPLVPEALRATGFFAAAFFTGRRAPISTGEARAATLEAGSAVGRYACALRTERGARVSRTPEQQQHSAGERGRAQQSADAEEQDAEHGERADLGV